MNIEKPRSERYMGQVWSVTHTQQAGGVATLALTNNLVMPADAQGDVPEHELHASYSGFYLALLASKNNEEMKIIRVCLRASGPDDDLSGLFDRYDYILTVRALLEKDDMVAAADAAAEVAAGDNSPAFVVKFSCGRYQGKTPAQVLLENPDNLSALQRNKEFLASKLQQYPRNQEVIDAIDDAIELMNIGELEARAQSKTVKRHYPPIVLIDEHEKVIDARSGDGRRTKCAVKIQFQYGEPNPWLVIVANSDFYEKKDESGKVEKSDYMDERSGAIALSDAEMSALIRKMKSQLNSFEGVSYQRAEDARRKYRAKG